MAAMLRPRGLAAARAVLSTQRRRMCAGGARTDGFNEALPRRDLVAPLLCAGVYGFSWWAADEGRIRALAEQADINTDPNANPTMNQVFHHLWPYVAGTLGMLFESVACKFASTGDMDWLCGKALHDDTNAAVALSLLVPPAEYSPAFARAICERPGALRRVNEIVQIYKTLPREQHDDVVVNAAILLAKVAALDELRAQGVGMGDFVWMMPEDKAHMYTQYGIEGVAALWRADARTAMVSGAVARTFELLDGPPLRPKKVDSSLINQLVAHRLFNSFHARRDALLTEAIEAEKSLARDAAAAGRQAPKKTVWQRAGVHRGETELELISRVRNSELDALRKGIAHLQAYEPRQPLLLLEQYTPLLSAASAAALGALYGAARGWFRGWWQDVTPSVCRELAAHASKRSALGAMLLVAAFEAAPHVKKAALEAAGASEVGDYHQPGALKQLVAVDVAYIALSGAINFAFPFALVPWACNPAQLLVLPSEATPPPPSKKAEA
jgi:hypothetical protein